MLALAAATAQPVTGTVGSPSATTSISGQQLPAPDPKFGGVIKNDALQSKPWWAPRVVLPKGAPNVLLIITDDAGFGVISEQSTGFPGYNSIIAKDKATIGRILLDNGYAISWFGKDHNVPAFAASQVGPFDQWPIGMGFEYFYGFVGDDANQWQPNLFRNTTQLYPFEGKSGWNLVTAMADDAIDYMNRMHQIPAGQADLHQVRTGATHAPHHPTKEWVDKISQMKLFDEGWNKLRERIFENQKRLGVIPKDAKLPPWPKEVLKVWEQLTAEEQKLFIRQVEVFAAYTAYTDHEIGRMVQAFEDLGRLDNTLPMILQWDESFRYRLGHADRRERCRLPPLFPLTAKLNKLTITVDRPTLSPADIQKLKGTQATAVDARTTRASSVLRSVARAGQCQFHVPVLRPALRRVVRGHGGLLADALRGHQAGVDALRGHQMAVKVTVAPGGIAIRTSCRLLRSCRGAAWESYTLLQTGAHLEHDAAGCTRNLHIGDGRAPPLVL